MTSDEDVTSKASGKAAGGRARAAAMTPEQRKAIAKKAAAARWDEVSEAICGSPNQPLRLGDVDVECYVLDDETRVVTQASFLKAIGRHHKANTRYQEGDEQLPPILQGKAIRPFISDEVIAAARPITFKPPSGGRASGYRADLLPKVCEIYLKARDADALPYQQKHVARQADIVMRALAHVGINALVDEATGYQEVRARDALARILEAFVDKELQKWIRTFPDDYYRELFRLRGLDYPTGTNYKPQYIGNLTNDIIYKRLAPGVLEELKKRTPRDEKGRHKNKLFQRLTTNAGYPALREHLGSVIMLMRMSRDWDDFKHKLDQWHPKIGDTMTLPIEAS